MINPNLAQEFKRVVKGSNVMTPDVIAFFPILDGVAELSTGRGFSNERIYGVTIVQNEKHCFDLSKLFEDKQEAINYIKSLEN